MCVSLPFDVLRRLLRGNLRTLRRLAVQHTHFAHGRYEAAASAGSGGIFVSAWTIAGRVLPIARLAGLVAFASLSCSGSSPEL